MRVGKNVYSKSTKATKLVKRQRQIDLPESVFTDEFEAIQARRAHADDPAVLRIEKPSEQVHPTVKHGLHGLAISGGGIRSATFATGVMQALAAQDLLKHMDYMSTVSGGGYAGSSLTWALYGENETPEEADFVKSFGVGPESFPLGTDDPHKPRGPKSDPKRRQLLDYLREHGKYLFPGGGVSAFSGIGVLFRGVLLNLLVWFGLAACLVLLILAKYGGAGAHFNWLTPGLIYGGGSLAVLVVFRKSLLGVLVWLVMAGVVAVVTLLKAPEGRDVFRCLWPTAWLLIGGAAICVLYAFLTFPAGWVWFTRARYWFRRCIERASTPYFIVIILTAVLMSLGHVYDLVKAQVATVSPAMILSGAAAGLWTHVTTQSKEKTKLPMGLIATVGSVLLIYGALLGAFAIAVWAERQGHATHLLWAFLAVLAMGWFVNINFISFHRFYRDRLMETFMPGIKRALENSTGGSYEADKAKLSWMWNPDNPRGPYHIINTNMVVVDSENRTLRTRGGENFILSPFYCGSTRTGWRRTEEFEQNGMTLATAMAISGAAANPHSGVGGKGLARNKFVSLLMALLNLRLGYWVRNCESDRAWLYPPNHFWPGGAYELCGMFKETSYWLQLSDGGHFENLALYELVRRRMKVIVILDAGADPGFNFADLQTASRRIEADFGAQIDFEKDNEPGRLVYPTDQEHGFPSYTGRAKTGFLLGKVRYADGETGDLVYIKTTMVADVSIETEGYKDGHPAFPDESTADQFFSPEQFEAYRDLGYVIGTSAAEKIRALVEPPSAAH